MIDVRLVAEQEHNAWSDQLGVAFFTHKDEGFSEYYHSHADEGRTRGAFDAGRVVGTMRSFATPLTVPGPAVVDASALTAVSVAPTHRRRGILSEMIVGDLRDSAARGEVVSVLLASEYPIYGRFGYGPATETAKFEVSSTDLHFLGRTTGSVELVDLNQLRELAPPVFERFRAAQHGSIGRRDEWWDRMLRQVEVPGAKPRTGFQAVYRGDSGDVEGYVLYEGKLEWQQFPPVGTLRVEEMVTTTDAAYRALWGYCFDVDLQTTTIASNRQVDEPLPLLVDDARKVRRTQQHDFLWVRVLDVERALTARRYTANGRVVIEVGDRLGLAGGRFALEVRDGTATCERSTDPAELTVDVSVLGATYLGGTSWTRLAATGWVDVHRTDALVLAERMCTTARAPWCTTYF